MLQFEHNKKITYIHFFSGRRQRFIVRKGKNIYFLRQKHARKRMIRDKMNCYC